MARALDHLQACRAGDQLDRFPQFVHRTEWIARPVNKDCGNTQFRKVFGSKLRRLPGRTQRIRKQQESVGQLRVFRRHHARLAPAIRLTGEVQRHTRCELPQFVHGLPDALPVTFA